MAENDSLMREVDDAVRRERYEQLWHRYRKPVLWGTSLIIVAMAGTMLWSDYQTKRAGEAMQQLDHAVTLLKQDDAAAAAKEFAALADTSQGEVRDVARLWQARALAKDNRADAALTTLTDLADHPAGRDLFWRDMACLRLMAAGADVPASCTQASASPLKTQRIEWHAAELWKGGNIKQARVLLEGLAKDENAPQTQRDRANRLLGALAAGAV